MAKKDPARMHRSSKEFLRIPLVGDVPDAVSVAILSPEVQPDPDTAAQWTVAEIVGTEARILVDPEERGLVPGRYRVWAWLTDAPEEPVKAAGTLTIF